MHTHIQQVQVRQCSLFKFIWWLYVCKLYWLQSLQTPHQWQRHTVSVVLPPPSPSFQCMASCTWKLDSEYSHQTLHLAHQLLCASVCREYDSRIHFHLSGVYISYWKCWHRRHSHSCHQPVWVFIQEHLSMLLCMASCICRLCSLGWHPKCSHFLKQRHVSDFVRVSVPRRQDHWLGVWRQNWLHSLPRLTHHLHQFAYEVLLEHLSMRHCKVAHTWRLG